MDSQKVIKRDKNCVLPTYNRNPIVLEKGHGLYAEGPEGQSYLDFTSGIGVNTLGYCDLAWAEAVSKQAHKLQHASNLYYTAPCGKLAKRLCQRTGMSRVFFANSGAEANEGAIKAARKYSFDHYGSDRYQIITLVNSFHGRTLATLTATGQGTFHQYFGPFNEGFTYTQAGDIEGLTELVDRHTCAILLELVQGEGGVVALDPDALSISGLHNYVKYLKSSGQDAGRYQLNMWSKIFQPLSVAVMMLMALSFIFGPLRSVPMGVRVVTGISFGFVFYVLDQIFGPLTLVYGIPPIIGALLPSASFFLISLWLLMRKS